MSQTAVQNQKQPKGLYFLFMVEMWERFSYYSLRGLFVLYLIHSLGFQRDGAIKLYGLFTSLVYLSPLIGGYIADRWWGQRKCIIAGALFMAFGQFTMGIHGMPFMYTALGLIIIGNGFFKPNISAMVGQMYEKNDPRRDGGFTIFYMGINLGAFIANLVAGTLGEKVGWSWGFWTAAVGMIIGLAIFVYGKDKYTPGIGLRPKDRPVKTEEEKAAMNRPLTKEEWQRVAVIFIMAFFSIFFWMLFEQKGAALNLFAYEHTDRVINFFGLGSWEIPATWMQSFNPMFIILFAPVVSKIWTSLAVKEKEPSTPGKFMIAFWLVAIGYTILLFAAMKMGPGIKVGLLYLVGAYFFFTMGELCLSPVGLSMVTKLSPAKFISFLMGIWFVATSSANYLAGFYGSYFGKIPMERFFGILVVVAVAASILLGFMVKPLKKWMHGVK